MLPIFIGGLKLKYLRPNYSSTRIDEFIASDAEELTIDKCNAFIRRLVHQEVRVRWPNKLRVESKSDCSGPSLVVQRSGTKEEEEQKEVERREREKLEIKQAVGLSLLLRKIADSVCFIQGFSLSNKKSAHIF